MTQNDWRGRAVVIGGAGFIGSHLVDALLAEGLSVRVVDNLDGQVHPGGNAPGYLNSEAEFVRQDIRDLEGLQKALRDAHSVFHFAGAVGVGDSMYRIRHYAEANVLGGANLLEILANQKHTIRKVVLASSVTVYGEGKYACPRHGIVLPAVRATEEMTNRQWEMLCPIQERARRCSEKLTPLSTDEGKELAPQSVYAVTKRAQEELFLTVGRTYGIPVTVLRYFNVYGSRQALSNPYTGVAKIFAQCFAQDETPVIYEDGLQTRDFVHVSDVVQASLLALQQEEANGEVFNVGTGRPTTILEMAHAVAEQFGKKATIEPSHRYRAGDVRHCWADISKIRARLGFKPMKIFPAGLEDVTSLAKSAGASAEACADFGDLAQRGLIL
jgi:dTDP-L-rhamnose 4-epimerase